MEALGGGGDLDVGADRGRGVCRRGVMRQGQRGPDGRCDEGGDVHPPVVPGNDLDCPAIRVAAVFGPCPVVMPREHPALNSPARHRGDNGVRLRQILQVGGELSFDNDNVGGGGRARPCGDRAGVVGGGHGAVVI